MTSRAEIAARVRAIVESGEWRDADDGLSTPAGVVAGMIEPDGALPEFVWRDGEESEPNPDHLSDRDMWSVAHDLATAAFASLESGGAR